MAQGSKRQKDVKPASRTEEVQASAGVGGRTAVPPAYGMDILDNQNVLSGSAGGFLIQPKLKLGPVDDPHEREANQASAGVLQRLDSDRVHRDRKIGLVIPTVQREVKESSNSFGGREVGQSLSDEIRRELGRGPGLDKGVQGSMERAFGANLPNITIHHDAEAEHLNRALDARAFTVGQDIFFGQGEYNPNSLEGKSVLAHELTHVFQQRGSVPGIQRTWRFRNPFRSPYTQMSDKRKKKGGYTEFRDDDDFPQPSSSNQSPKEDEPGESSTEEEKEKYFETTGSLTLDGGEAKPEDVAARILGAEATKEEIDALVELYKEPVEKIKSIAEAVRSVVEAKDEKKIEGKLEGKRETTATISKETAIEAINFTNGIKATQKIEAELSHRGELEGEVQATYRSFMAQVAFHAETFLGIIAGTTGEFKLDVLDGLIAKAAYEAQVGASIEGTAHIEINIGKLAEIEADLSGEAFAGARGSGSLEIVISPERVKFAGEVENLMGVMAEGEANFTGKFLGEKVLGLGAKGSVEAGLGFKVGGRFEIEGGKLILGVELAAALGLGIGVGISIEMNYHAILQKIADTISKTMYTNLRTRKGYRPLIEGEDFEPTVRKEIQKFKENRGKTPKNYKGTDAIKKLYFQLVKKIVPGKNPEHVDKYVKWEIFLIFGEEFGRELEHLQFRHAPHPELDWSTSTSSASSPKRSQESGNQWL